MAPKGLRNDGGYELVFAFRDQSPSFAHGFTCGRIWQQMKGDQPFSVGLYFCLPLGYTSVCLGL